jgi:hypothetical protein
LAPAGPPDDQVWPNGGSCVIVPHSFFVSDDGVLNG